MSTNQAPGLHVADYCVAVVILVVPLLIGILFAFKDHKKNTRLEYLLGGRQMSILPVTMSTFVTFVSGVAILGLTSETYLYGTGMTLQVFAACSCYLVSSFTVVPLLYPLPITSVYEYLQLRFHSNALRMFCTLIGCLQTMLYMAIVLLSSAFALQSIGEIPLWMSILVVGGVGTIYTVIGGIKSVIWTDVFQTLIVFIGLIAIIIKGSMIVGGLDKAWSIASDAGRIQFSNFNPDPRVRMSVWGSIIGIFFIWLNFTYSQATVQRIRSLKTLRDARLSYLLNIPFCIVVNASLLLAGVVTYAYFDFIKCDPIQNAHITNPNQIMPHFVYTAMHDLPGIAGMFVATLLCGTLSTFSSGINALAANTIEDILERPLKNLTERSVTMTTKMVAGIIGVCICFLAYSAQYLEGPVSQMAGSTIGALGSPITGIFLLGSIVPWANKFGAFAGGLVSLAFNLWISIGSTLHGRRYPTLPPAATGIWDNSTFAVALNTSFLPDCDLLREKPYNSSVNSPSDPSPHSHAYGFPLYDVSYEWFPVFGFATCLIAGLAVSFCTRHKSWRESTGIYHLVFPISRRIWSLPTEAGRTQALVHFPECKELL